MEIVITHGADLDAHKRRIVAIVLTPATETCSFGTLTADLLALVSIVWDTSRPVSPASP